MGEIGYLLGIPTQSVAIRLMVAALVAIPLARLLLKIGIRQPRLRALASLVPAIVLAAVLGLSWGDKQLPRLMQSFNGRGLSLRVGDTYWDFAPFAAGLLVAVWALVAGTRITLRILRLRKAHARIADQVRQSAMLRPSVVVAAERVASRMRLPLPPLAVVPSCPGGAAVHGIRRPQLLLDERLVDRLDGQELEGVIAHELAHVHRRDNLMAVLVAIVRDLFFFVPGAGWASRQLHAERELAADQVAATATRRPGALASGLLKVMDLTGPAAVGCAALVPEMPSSTVTGRVRLLIEPQEVTRLRRGMEVTTVVVAIAVAAGAGIGGPALVASGDGVDEVHLAWTPSASTPSPAGLPALDTTATAFDVYRSMPRARVEPTATTVVLDDDPNEFRRSTIEACRVGAARACSTQPRKVGLGMRARTTVRLPASVVDEWRATPVLTTDVFNVYFLRHDAQQTP